MTGLLVRQSYHLYVNLSEEIPKVFTQPRPRSQVVPCALGPSSRSATHPAVRAARRLQGQGLDGCPDRAGSDRSSWPSSAGDATTSWRSAPRRRVAFYGAFPIMWILLNAIWVYQLSVITGWFDTLGLIRSVSDDQRILAILIAFCFGALMEALAGFGAPVAISAAMLMAAGMKPMKSADRLPARQHRPGRLRRHGCPDHRPRRGRHPPPEITTGALRWPVARPRSSPRSSRWSWSSWSTAGAASRRPGRSPWSPVSSSASPSSSPPTSSPLRVTDVVASLVTIAAVLPPCCGCGSRRRSWASEGAVEAARTTAHAAVAVTAGSAWHRVRRRGHRRRTAAGSAPTRPRTTTVPTDNSRPEPRQIWMAIAPYLIIIAVFSVAQIPVVKAWLAPGRQRRRSPGPAWTSPTRPASRSRPPSSSSTTSRPTGTLLLFSGLLTMVLYKVTASQGAADLPGHPGAAALDHRHRHRRAGPVLRDEPVRPDHHPGLRPGLRRRLLRHRSRR